MPNNLLSIECVNDRQIGIALNFRRNGDRFEHEICLVNGDRQFPMLTSIESDAQSERPDSPPMQQVSRETILGQPAVMGIGMAGCSHWSGSFLLKNSPMPELICELACLMGQPGQQLQSKYVIAPGLAAIQGAHHGQSWQLIDQPGIDVAGVTLASDSDSIHASRIEIEDAMVRIQPSMVAQNPSSAIQWKYRIFLTPDRVAK